MSANKNMPDVEELIQRYFDQVISEPEREALIKALEMDADLRRDFLRGGVIRARMHEWAKRQVLGDRRRAEGTAIGGRHGRRMASARKRGRVRWSVWISIAACLAIIVGAHLINLRQTEQFVEVLVAHIQKTEPNVKVIRGADGRVVAAIVGLDVFAGDRIETGDGRKATIAYPAENTIIDVDENTMLDIGGVKDGKRLHLNFGAIKARAARQPRNKPLIITTEQAKVEVVGTIFRLSAGAASTRVDVITGLVRFTRLSDGENIDVEEGSYAIAGEGIELISQSITESGIAADPAPDAKPVRYVDGPVILQDDFDGPVDRAMENWSTVLWDEGAKKGTMKPKVPTTEEESRFLSIEKRKVRGKVSQVVHLDFDGFRKDSSHALSASISLRMDVRALVERGPVSIEWDDWSFPETVLYYMNGTECRHVKKIFLRRGHKTASLAWRRHRTEIVSLTDALGVGHYRIRSLEDEVLIEENIYYYGSFHIGFIVEKGTVDVDNVVVRRMVPEKE